VTLIEADNERDEALALAIALREVLETPALRLLSSRRTVNWRDGAGELAAGT